MAVVTFKSVHFEWADGQSVLCDLNLTLSSGRRYGLVGPNGVGKSTLAKLIAGELEPTRGSVTRNGRFAYLAQWAVPPVDRTGEELIGELWSRLSPAESAVAAQWAGNIDLLRKAAQLSGGEWTRIQLMGLLAENADFLVLDEPTNSLDAEARRSMQDFIRNFTQGILVVSHDRELLQSVDVILELTSQELTTYGGGWDFYEAERARERERLQGQLESAQRERRVQERTRQAALVKQRRRMSHAAKSAPTSGMVTGVLGARKRRAQKTLGKLQVATEREVDRSAEAAREAYARLKEDPEIYATAPSAVIPMSRWIAEARDFNFRFSPDAPFLWENPLNFSLRGPGRVAITGANGVGKSTLLKLLIGKGPVDGEPVGDLKLGNIPYGWLDQSLSQLNDEVSVLENVLAGGSKQSIADVRNSLARFLFAGKMAERRVNQLSGGERLRAGLAQILLADPAPQLLILDEPTNDLDIGAVEFMERSLANYEGAILVASHDQIFLNHLKLTAKIRLS